MIYLDYPAMLDPIKPHLATKRTESASFLIWYLENQLGRLGGAKGGKARAANMTKKERSEAARKAANARWAKKRQQEGAS